MRIRSRAAFRNSRHYDTLQNLRIGKKFSLAVILLLAGSNHEERILFKWVVKWFGLVSKFTFDYLKILNSVLNKLTLRPYKFIMSI